MVQQQPHRAARDQVAIGQGLFYLITGVWPLVHMRSFEAITGPKTDRWLVQTAGLLISVIGAVLLRAGIQHRTTDDHLLLGVGSAAGLAAIDVIHVSRRRIAP